MTGKILSLFLSVCFDIYIYKVGHNYTPESDTILYLLLETTKIFDRFETAYNLYKCIFSVPLYVEPCPSTRKLLKTPANTDYTACLKISTTCCIICVLAGVRLLKKPNICIRLNNKNLCSIPLNAEGMVTL